MKKIITLIFSVLCVVSVCSGCYVRTLDSSRNYRYYPPEAKTAYDDLLSYTGSLGDKWNFSSNWTILKKDKSADDTTTPKDTYIKALGDLKDIMNGVTLYGLVQPENVSDYNKYAEDLLDGKPSDYELWANFGTTVTNKISDNDIFFNNLRIIITGASRCYVIADYKKSADSDSKRYAYYSEDKTLIDNIDKWADKYMAENLG
ncbi:MAG: hypothetical protein Q8876_10305 [Bacillota bacterium]|nr:hypothetical protein [Bacillota bacterium]